MVLNFLKNYKKILIGALVCLAIIFSLISVFLFFHNTDQILERSKIQLQDIADNVDRYDRYFENYDTNYQIEETSSVQAVASLIELSNITDDIEAIKAYIGQLNGIYCIADRNRNLILDGISLHDEFDFMDPQFDSLFFGENLETREIDYENYHFTSHMVRDYYLISVRMVSLTDTIEDETQKLLLNEPAWMMILNDSWIGDDSIWAVAPHGVDEILFSKDEILNGAKIDSKQIQNSYIYSFGDTDYIAVMYPCEKKNVDLYAFTPVMSLVRSNFYGVRVEMVLFLGVMILLISFVIFLRADELDPGTEFKFLGKYFLGTQVRRYLALALACGITIFSLCILLIDLSDVSGSYARLKEQAEKNAEAIIDMQQFEKVMESNSANKFYRNGNMVNIFLKTSKGPITKETLNTVAGIFDVKYISVFDAEGNTIISSSPMDHISLLDDKESPLYDLRYVLMGKNGMVVSADTNKMGKDEVIYAVPRRNDEGVADGLIAIITTKGKVESAAYMAEENTANTFYNLQRQLDGSIFFAVDQAGIITLHPEKNWIGKPVSECGISLSDLQNEFSGRISMNDEEYFASSVEYEDQYIISAGIIRWFTGSTLLRAFISLVLFVFLAFWIFYDGLGSKYHFVERKAKVKDADDWRNTKITWADFNTRQKFGLIIRYGIYAFSLYLITIAFLGDVNVIYDFGFSFILSGEWNKSFNIFAVIGNFCLLCVVYSVAAWIKFFLKIISRAAGGETISRLLSSVVRYAGVVIAFYFCAINFGIDAKSAWTSLGLAGVGLSFGAQDLIKDVIAGIFILFEGNYKVGDLLLINNEWFWVRSIGVRTTKVEAWGKVKIINNSQMTSGVANIQNASACVNCDIYIGKEYDLKDIEEILCKELPKLKENYPPEVATPTYKGVQDITAYGTQIRIRTYCPPLYQGSVGRSLRKEVARIFKEYDIRVPSVSYELSSYAVEKEVLIDEAIESAKRVNEKAEALRKKS